MGDFTMPSLGADMEAGTVTEWLVAPGAEVHRGDVVAVVETDKSAIEVEVFETGTIEEIVVPVGERVPVGTVLAHVAPTPAGAATTPSIAPRAVAAADHPPRPVPAHPATVVSPVVRHLSERLGVDVAGVKGSGPGEVVTRHDVERAAQLATQPGTRPRAERDTKRRTEASPDSGAQRVRSSPLARRLAAELGLDLRSVAGSGPGGSVVASDVRRAGTAMGSGAAENHHPAPRTTPETKAPAAAPISPSERLGALRRAIGALMARSKREVPHYYLSTTIDLRAASAWVEETNLKRSVTERLVLSALLLKATARAVAKVPEMNGFFVDNALDLRAEVHLGVAVSLRGGGVIAPALHNSDQLSLDELMARLTSLVARARSGVLRGSEMSDPTITVTNLGDLGVDAVFGVIYPPQVALVGFGRVREEPFADGGMVGVRPCVTATLSGDHRASDGMRGARYLAEIDRLLQHPEEL